MACERSSSLAQAAQEIEPKFILFGYRKILSICTLGKQISAFRHSLLNKTAHSFKLIRR